ncbi:MAG: riboflavin kinase [Saprospiraceae bacterium]|nr:riboflavin kinase [Saprospiraceae bacterium]
MSDQIAIIIEINIFDFSQNIYDKVIQIHILEFLRKDIRFDNLDQLKDQLQLDEKNAQLALSSSIINPKRSASCDCNSQLQWC